MFDKQIIYSVVLSILYAIIAGVMSTIYLSMGWLLFILVILLPIAVLIISEVEYSNFFLKGSAVLVVIISVGTIFGYFKVKKNIVNFISDFNILIETIESDKVEMNYSNIPLLEIQKKSIDNRLKKYAARSLLNISDYDELEEQYKRTYSELVSYREKSENCISSFKDLINEMENDSKKGDSSRILLYKNRKAIIDTKRLQLNFSDEHNEIYNKLIKRYDKVYSKLSNPDKIEEKIKEVAEKAMQTGGKILDGVQEKGSWLVNWIKNLFKRNKDK